MTTNPGEFPADPTDLLDELPVETDPLGLLTSVMARHAAKTESSAVTRTVVVGSYVVYGQLLGDQVAVTLGVVGEGRPMPGAFAWFAESHRPHTARRSASDERLLGIVRHEVQRALRDGLHVEVATAVSEAIVSALGGELRTAVREVVEALAIAGNVSRKQRRGASALLLSKREAAKRLGIDRNKALPALIESGQIQTVPKNGIDAIPATEIDRLVQEGFDTTVTRRPSRRRARPKVLRSETATSPSGWKLKL